MFEPQAIRNLHNIMFIVIYLHTQLINPGISWFQKTRTKASIGLFMKSSYYTLQTNRDISTH